ncbi:MAG: hypothetical protein JXD22_14625 [Sedimentisphaerales bacterium]|nr:hypothetical protein [Sedimentisphaerales bacterium]
MRKISILTRTRRILGIALEDDQILLSELHCIALRYRIIRTETFSLSPEANFTEPARLGTALHEFLQEHHFWAKEVVVGLPAKWLLVKENEVPCVQTESLPQIARLMAEREFSLDMNDLVLDYTSSDNSNSNRYLVVMATLRSRMNPIIAALRAAGLKVISVTASSPALPFPETKSPTVSNYGLYLRPNYAEFLVRNGKDFHSVKHISFHQVDGQDSGKVPASLVQQLNNIFSTWPVKSDPDQKDTLVVWGVEERTEEFRETLQQHLQRSFNISRGLEVLKRENWEEQNGPESEQYAVSTALAVMGLRSKPAFIDFLNSKICFEEKTSRKKTIMWSLGAAAALLVAVFFLIGSWHQDKQEILTLTNTLEEMKEEIDAVESLAQKVTSAQGWYSGRPKILDCLRELTLSFPEAGTIWVTSLALREDMRGIITGKSLDETSVLEVIDELKANHVFSNVQMLYLRDTGRSSQEVAFAIDFIYTNGK